MTESEQTDIEDLIMMKLSYGNYDMLFVCDCGSKNMLTFSSTAWQQ